MKQSKRGKKRKRKEMKDAFDLLPKPHNEYEIVRPAVKPEDSYVTLHGQPLHRYVVEAEKLEDLMDVEARKEQALLRQREKEAKRQTQAVQRKCDRPKRIVAVRTFPDEKNKYHAFR